MNVRENIRVRVRQESSHIGRGWTISGTFGFDGAGTSGGPRTTGLHCCWLVKLFEDMSKPKSPAPDLYSSKTAKKTAAQMVNLVVQVVNHTVCAIRCQ